MRTNVYFVLDNECLFVYYKNIEKNKRSERVENSMTRTNTRKRYRIKNRVRFAAFIVISLLMVCTLANTVLGFNNAVALTEQQYIEITVEPGDSLWTIAKTHMSDDMDPRKAVRIIMDENDMADCQVYVGQTLSIPVE